MPNGIPVETKRQIITQELQDWKRTQYQMIIRHRVLKNVDATPQQLEEIEKVLERCEKAIDTLHTELQNVGE